MLPDVTILMTTYFPPGDGGEERKTVAASTLWSWGHYLHYDGDGDFRLHVADDGSGIPFTPKWGEHTTFSCQDHHGYGASLNAGFRKAFETSPIVLHAVDDWSLTEDFNITPWVQLLIEREDVGMVRLGPPHPNLTGKVAMLTESWEGWGLVLDRQSFAFGLRPCLIHQRMIDAYGWFKEDTSALECEREYNDNFCSSPGPDIVLALPHPWLHLGDVSLSGLEPK